MALFATAEEKEKKKEEKQEKEFKKLTEKYHLTDLDKDDYELIRSISNQLAGSTWGEVSVFMSGSVEERMKLDKLNALQEQNWIIINQLGRLNKNIKELIEINKNK